LRQQPRWSPQEFALETGTGQPRKRREILLFLFITVVLFPVLSVMIVGGYGFAVWIYQMIAGPPGPAGG
jgi:nitrate reductase NapE